MTFKNPLLKKAELHVGQKVRFEGQECEVKAITPEGRVKLKASNGSTFYVPPRDVAKLQPSSV